MENENVHYITIYQYFLSDKDECGYLAHAVLVYFFFSLHELNNYREKNKGTQIIYVFTCFQFQLYLALVFNFHSSTWKKGKGKEGSPGQVLSPRKHIN